MLYKYNEILFSLKWQGNSDTRCSVGEAWGYYAKWNELVTKRQLLYNSKYMRCLEYTKSKRKKVEW